MRGPLCNAARVGYSGCTDTAVTSVVVVVVPAATVTVSLVDNLTIPTLGATHVVARATDVRLTVANADVISLVNLHAVYVPAPTVTDSRPTNLRYPFAEAEPVVCAGS